MPVPLIAVATLGGKLVGAVQGIGGALGIHGASPRYAGGPLISTVEGGIRLIASGDLNTIRSWDTARKTAKDKDAWQQVWDNELPSIPLTPAQATLVRQLDPRLGITGVGAAASLPATPSSVAPTPAGPGTSPGMGAVFGAGSSSMIVVVVVILVLVFLLKGR